MQIGPTRGSSQLGPGPITFQEIEAYCRLTETQMLPWEVMAIREMDDAVLTKVRQELSKER